MSELDVAHTANIFTLLLGIGVPAVDDIEDIPKELQKEIYNRIMERHMKPIRK